MDWTSRNIGNGSLLLELREELDLYGASEFRKGFQNLFKIHRPKGVILSMEHLDYIDSSGVGVLLSILKYCHGKQCRLYFCGLNRQCKEIISMTHLDRVFSIFPNEYKALRHMHDSLKSSKTDQVLGPIVIDEDHDNFNKDNLQYKCINIDFKRIRYISHIITQGAPEEIKEHNLLEQQVSEVIKNAVRHGNRNDISKEIKIWWNFSEAEARLIVEDQGKGFQNMEEWNRFYHQRMKRFLKGEPEEMLEFLSYRTKDSTPEDGGNALFAAMEYWNQGYVLNQKRNAVGLVRKFVI